MEEQKQEENVIKRRHFAKLHEKIQNKYHEMQRRLEKSKSFDSISTLSDELSFKDSRYASNNDLRESDELFASESEVEISVIQTAVVKNINKQNAIAREIEYNEVNYLESEYDALTPIEHGNENFDDEWVQIAQQSPVELKLNLDLINDVEKDSDDSTHRPAPSPRTIKDRIESRISAVRERRERRREEKEKHLKEKKESRDKIEKFILSNTTKQDIRPNRKNKLATVTVALIEATGIDHSVDEKARLLFCRFRLGTEKYKSKVVRMHTTAPKWQELFNLNMYDEHILEASLWDKDTCIGSAHADLTELEKEKTHNLKLKLEGEASETVVTLHILLTISGISLLNTILEIDDLEKVHRELEMKKNEWYRLSGSFSEVGWLSVIVYGAKGLVAQDCYCVLKLTNERVQTHTEYKTNDPNWMKIFTFKLTDITSVLEVTVVEEKKAEGIGRVSIPLLRINNGHKVWYALKDPTQRERAKGNNPRILLEMSTSWNLIKASVRVINPKEADILQTKGKFDRRVFARNLSRAKTVIKWTLDTFRLMKTCFEWESRKSNTLALVIWILFCYFFKIWMLPLLLLIPFVRYRPAKWRNIIFRKFTPVGLHDDKTDKEEKSTLRQKINSLQEMVQTVQNGIGKVASIGESIKNLFNFTVPFVSSLAVFLIVVIALVMYIVPLKCILITWGIHKFTRKILRPNRIPNSEIMDLLSRVPDDETMLDWQEFSIENTSDEDGI